jgi:ribonuclease HI
LNIFFSKPKNKEQPVRAIKWKPPEHDVLKINTDGSMDPARASGGWGFVFRDELGEVVGSGAGCMNHVQDVVHAEAEACLQALLQAQNWGISRVHAETDSQLLVQAINGGDQDLARNGAILREIKF